jgi:hypothetical protein
LPGIWGSPTSENWIAVRGCQEFVLSKILYFYILNSKYNISESSEWLY